MKKNTIIVAVVAIIIIGLIVMWSQNNKEEGTQVRNEQGEVMDVNNTKTTNNKNNPTLSESEQVVRTKLLALGQKMDLVYTKAADFKNQVQVQYADYITPTLINEWQANPGMALAKTSIDTYPDRIEIQSVVKKSDTMYVAQATVIEVDLQSSEVVSAYPITVTFENKLGEWYITKVVK